MLLIRVKANLCEYGILYLFLYSKNIYNTQCQYLLVTSILSVEVLLFKVVNAIECNQICILPCYLRPFYRHRYFRAENLQTLLIKLQEQ